MRGINLTPNSASETERVSVGDQQLHDSRIKYNKEERERIDEERRRVVLNEAGATGVTYRGKPTEFETAVERVQGLIRSGRVSYAQAKVENDADAQRLEGWKIAPPRPGTLAAIRQQETRERYKIRSAALQQERLMAPPATAPPPTAVRESNDCHAPDSGRFCSGGRSGRVQDYGVETSRSVSGQRVGKTLATRARSGDEAMAAARAAGHDAHAAWPAPGGKFAKGTGPFERVAKPKVEYTTNPANPNHIANYRGMEIHTLPSYMTPYYFVQAKGKGSTQQGFGPMQHSRSLGRVKRQIDTFKDTGQTAAGAERAKWSARYQKRKAAGY